MLTFLRFNARTIYSPRTSINNQILRGANAPPWSDDARVQCARNVGPILRCSHRTGPPTALRLPTARAGGSRHNPCSASRSGLVRRAHRARLHAPQSAKHHGHQGVLVSSMLLMVTRRERQSTRQINQQCGSKPLKSQLEVRTIASGDQILRGANAPGLCVQSSLTVRPPSI